MANGRTAGGAPVVFNERNMDTHRAFAHERNGGLELPSRRLNRDAGPKDGDWLCMTCGYRNWRHWGICLHCVQAFAAPPGPNVPEWNHGQIVAGGGDTGGVAMSVTSRHPFRLGHGAEASYGAEHSRIPDLLCSLLCDSWVYSAFKNYYCIFINSFSH